MFRLAVGVGRVDFEAETGPVLEARRRGVDGFGITAASCLRVEYGVSLSESSVPGSPSAELCRLILNRRCREASGIMAGGLLPESWSAGSGLSGQLRCRDADITTFVME